MASINFTENSYSYRLKSFFKTKEAKAYTMAILSLFAISFFTIFAIKPTLNTFFALQKQIKDYQEFDKELEKKINDLLKAQEIYRTYKDDAYLLKEALPSDPQIPDVLKKIENISKDSKVELADVSVKDVLLIGKNKETQNQNKVPADYASFNFTFTTKGLYTDSETILKRFLNLRRLIAYNGIELTREEKSQDNNGKSISAKINAKAYYLTNLNNEQ